MSSIILDLLFEEVGRIFNEIARRFMGNIYISATLCSPDQKLYLSLRSNYVHVTASVSCKTLRVNHFF